MNNPKCPKCAEELSIGRMLYLRSTKLYYRCHNGCARFTFGLNTNGFYSEENLRECFNKEHIPEYAI